MKTLRTLTAALLAAGFLLHNSGHGDRIDGGCTHHQELKHGPPCHPNLEPMMKAATVENAPNPTAANT